MMATAPATNTGRVNRSMRYTQNMVDIRDGSNSFTAIAATMSGTPIV